MPLMGKIAYARRALTGGATWASGPWTCCSWLFTRDDVVFGGGRQGFSVDLAGVVLFLRAPPDTGGDLRQSQASVLGSSGQGTREPGPCSWFTALVPGGLPLVGLLSPLHPAD